MGAPTACGRTVSGSLSLRCPRCFSPFPHGTCALSVSRECLALADGAAGFGQGSSDPALLRVQARLANVPGTGLSPSADSLSRLVPLRSLLPRRLPCNPARASTPAVWAGPLSLAATRGVTLVFLSSAYLDVSVRRVRPGQKPVPRPRAAGCPIRKPADQRPLAPPRGISSPATSFIASGSHRHPPCALSRLPLPAAPRQRSHHGTANARSSCVFSLLDYSLRSLSPRPAHNRPVSQPSATRRDASSFHPVNEPPPCPRREKWRMRGSNPRPPACKAGALAN